MLLDNAINYSPEDQPVDLMVTLDAQGAAMVRIRDRGPGLTPGDRATVFARFARGSAAVGTPGSGLGLAIALALAGRHDASIELLAAHGGGTIAGLRFPAPG